MSKLHQAPANFPAYDIDLFSDAVIQDPFPHYAAIRKLGPVVWLPQNKVFALGRYKEVTEALRAPRTFVSSRGLSLQQKVNDILIGSTLNSDPPEHDLTRGVTSEPLFPGALTEHLPRIESAANKLIESLAARGEFDAITDLASHLPVTIVAELVGLPDEGRDRLLNWASATFNLFGPDNARSQDAFEDLKSLRDFLAVYGQPDKLKPGGWAKRIFEVGPQRGINLETCAQLMRDYINPSLDTTISATGQAIWFFAQHPDQWEKVRRDQSLIPNAIEEIIRLSTPIRMFSRYVVHPTEIAGLELPADSRVLVIYASANRDNRKYVNPDQFDVTRDVHDHVGFGHGVHMCMGMHLARMEIACLLAALAQRVSRFEIIGEPSIAMNNTIRAFSSLPVRIQVDTMVNAKKLAQTVTSAPQSHWIDVRVDRRRDLTDRIVELTLQASANLPAAQAGAHIDVEVSPGLVRQYSLTGDLSASPSGRYRIGVLKEPDGLASPKIHQLVHSGTTIRVGPPRNHFRLDETVGRTLLFAAGIGITPILAMAYRLRELGHDFHLHYRFRNKDQAAFLDELAQFAPHVTLSTSDEAAKAHPDFNERLFNADADCHLYVCGPAGFMRFVNDQAMAAGWQREQIHTEHFGAEINTDGDSFDVRCERSGITVAVHAGETIASKLHDNGIDIPMSCQSGICGTCLTRVLDGRPDHRDLVLTDLEKAENQQITVCCSRSLTQTLVLDI